MVPTPVPAPSGCREVPGVVLRDLRGPSTGLYHPQPEGFLIPVSFPSALGHPHPISIHIPSLSLPTPVRGAHHISNPVPIPSLSLSLCHPHPNPHPHPHLTPSHPISSHPNTHPNSRLHCIPISSHPIPPHPQSHSRSQLIPIPSHLIPQGRKEPRSLGWAGGARRAPQCCHGRDKQGAD